MVLPSETNYILSVMGKRRAVLFLLVIIVISILDLLGIAIIFPYLQAMLHPEKLQNIDAVSYLYNAYPYLDNTLLLLSISMLLGLFFLLKTVVIIFLNRYQFKQHAWLTNMLTSSVVRLALNSRYSLFHELPVSQVAGKAYTNTVHASLYFKALVDFVSESLFVTFFLMGLSVMYPWLALSLVLAALILGWAIYIGVVKRVASLGQKQTAVEDEKHKLLYFMASGMRDINVMGLGKLFADKNDVLAEECAEINWRYQLQGSLPRIFIELIMLLTFVGGATILLNMDRHRLEMMAPLLGVLAVAALRLIPSFSKLIASINVYRFSGQFVRDLHALVKKLEHAQMTRKEDSLTLCNEIVLKNINFNYGDKVILQDVSMTIAKKKSIGIVGASGAGKSTLLDLITGLQPAGSGEFYSDGKLFDPFTSLSIQRMTGYVPQKITLLDASIAFNIAFKEDYDSELLEEAINTANLVPVLKTLPNGVNTTVGENGVRLSGGQAQRVGIARAIYHQPDLLVFDEATSALDNVTERALTNDIKLLGRDMAVIIVAHRLSTVKHCDCIYVMDGGVVVDSGKHYELMQRCKLYQEMNSASKIDDEMKICKHA